LNIFREKVDEKLNSVQLRNMEELGDIVKDTAEEVLRRKYRKKYTDEETDTRKEKPWFTEDIRREIKKRKYLNRERRNESDVVIKEMKKAEYTAQKNKVQNMIKEEISKYEKRIAKDLKEDRSRKKVWDCIKKLQGKEIKKEELRLYSESGEALQADEERQQLRRTWEDIYRKSENKIDEYWNSRIKVNYEEEEKNNQRCKIRKKFLLLDDNYKVERREVTFEEHMREHFDMTFRLDNPIKSMQCTRITKKDVCKQIKKMKFGKSPGPDELKIEIYKELMKSDEYMEELVSKMNKQLDEGGDVPESWRGSKTRMIKKKAKPTARELRPIALTNNEYKIFMGVIKEKIEEHIERIGEARENQAGFTCGRRIEDNLLILKYCIEETYRTNQELYIAAIDYSKAFDSVDRGKMIEILKRFKVDGRLISQIASVYSKDWTEVYLRDEMKERINITNGIRQGCTGSALLFKLITYEVMRELDCTCEGFRNEKFTLTSLFYADDGLLIAKSKRELIKSLQITQKKSEEYGLELNRDKSNIMIFNGNEDVNLIEGIKIVENIKYLGVCVSNKRDTFIKHKEKILNDAQKLANVTSIVIEKSVCRTLIGKTYWKNVAMPSFMHAVDVVSFNSGDVKKLQTIENSVWRRILNGRSYTPISALRGEIGASSVESRIMKSKLKYEWYLKCRGGELMRSIYEDMTSKKHKWTKECETYRDKVDLMGGDRKQSEEMNDYISRKCKKYDDILWQREMEEKSSMKLYRIWKSEIREESWLDGSLMARIWMEARSNTMRLHDRNRFSGEDTRCTLCGYEKEDREHFILRCPRLSDTRAQIEELQQPYEEDISEVIGRFLFDDKDMRRKMERLSSMYRRREQLMEL